MRILFEIVLNMSAAGSLVFALSFLLRPLTKKVLNATWRYAISILVTLLMLVPLSAFITSETVDVPGFIEDKQSTAHLTDKS